MNASRAERHVCHLIERIWNEADAEALAELCHTDMVLRLPRGQRIAGRGRYMAYIQQVRAQFHDLRVSVHELALLDNHLALRYVWTGIFAGGETALGPAAAGGRVIVEGLGLYHLLDGRVLVGTCSEDWLSMYGQLGVLPEMSAERPMDDLESRVD